MINDLVARLEQPGYQRATPTNMAWSHAGGCLFAPLVAVRVD